MFITFEGIDYCGKSTQAKLLYNYLKSQKLKIKLLREPGGTEPSEKIREILLNKASFKLYPLTELFLFSAARAQLVNDVIKPYLKKNYIVICDRFTDSTVAYQGYGGQLNIKMVEKVNSYATQGLIPDITFLIDISPNEAIKRVQVRNEKKDRMENKNLAFHKRVHKGFKEIELKNKKRFVVIDGLKSIDNIHNEIITFIKTKLAI